jgi:hypothetical protein
MIKEFKKITKWVESQGFTVRFSKCDEVNYTDREITLYHSQNKEKMIYSFLHECGHIIVSNKKYYKKNFKILHKAHIDGRHAKSNLFKYKQLREEIQAWESGFKLSEKLGIKINKEDYDKYASKCFNTYIK